MTLTEFRTLFRAERPLIGMVHLRPLPGSPRYGGSMAVVLAQAQSEAAQMAEAGFHGLLVENFNDAPFYPGSVPSETVAAMAVAVHEVCGAVAVPVGVNVLRNDGAAALAVAAATDAEFVRVNVLTGAMVTDQGIIEGRAHDLLRLRRALGASTRIFADVLVKHAQPLGLLSLEQAAEEAVGRGLADALIVTGAGTGKPTPLTDAQAVRAAVPGVPVLVGSGVTVATVADCLQAADGAIVGSAFKQGGRADAPMDPERVAAFIAAARG